MAVFTVLIGPFALSFHMHFPDEMYYRDAAVKMMQNGDYLTTYLGNGELRFRKPIGTYWVVLAGFKLFGVSAFASRFFFLIAGALTIGVTYWLAKLLFEDKKVAGISVLIIAANPVLILAATRSIPDVLLGLTMTLSAIGFAGLIRFGDQVPKKYLWMLYISLALAFEVKGIPAVALGGLGLLYLIFNPWKKLSIKTFLHFPAIFTALFIALFWFVAMWKIHGPTYLDSFFEDQVGNRVASRYLLILKNGALATGILLGVFIPWTLLVIPRFKDGLRKAWAENKVFFAFAVLWGLAILGMGAMTAKFYERYLLPVTPVLAVFLGWVLVRAEFEFRQKGLKAFTWFFLILGLVVGLIGLWVNIQLGSTVWIYLQLLVGLIVWMYLARLIVKGEKLPKALSYSYLLLFFFISTATAKISLPEQGEQVSKFVSVNNVDPTEEIGFVGNIHASSKIRVYLGTDYNLTNITGERKLSDEELVIETNKFQYLIVEDKFMEKLDTNLYTIQEAAINWDSKKIPYLLQQVSSSEFEDLVKENGKIYYWLEKNPNQ